MRVSWKCIVELLCLLLELLECSFLWCLSSAGRFYPGGRGLYMICLLMDNYFLLPHFLSHDLRNHLWEGMNGKELLFRFEVLPDLGQGRQEELFMKTIMYNPSVAEKAPGLKHLALKSRKSLFLLSANLVYVGMSNGLILYMCVITITSLSLSQTSQHPIL